MSIAPISLITAVNAFKDANPTSISAETAKAIIEETKTFSDAFSFIQGRVMIHMNAVHKDASTDTQSFITWLRMQKYTNVSDRDTTYFAEHDAGYERRIVSLEQERRSMETRFDALQQEKAAIQTDLRAARAEVGDKTDRINVLTRDSEQDKFLSGSEIARLKSRIADLERTLSHTTAELNSLKDDCTKKEHHSKDQQRTINDLRLCVDQTTAGNTTLAAENATLRTDNARLVAENARLMADNRDLRNQARRGGRAQQQNAIDWVLTKTTPPFLMDACEAMAPVGAYISDATGLSRLLKRKRDD